MKTDLKPNNPPTTNAKPAQCWVFMGVVMKTSQELWAENFRRAQDGRVKPLSYQHLAEWQDVAAAEDAAKNAALQPVPYKRYIPSKERINAALLKMKAILCKSH